MRVAAADEYGAPRTRLGGSRKPMLCPLSYEGGRVLALVRRYLARFVVTGNGG
jgi:hypothetical protein